MQKFWKTRSKQKYSAQKTEVDGKTFDSKKEARYYLWLKEQVSEGKAHYFLRQVPFDLPGKTKYRCDFMVVWADGKISYIDVKGFETKIFKMKKKQVEELYPVEIAII